MNLEDFQISHKCVDILTAREMLNAIQVSTVKNRKKPQQQKILSALEKMANPKIGKEDSRNLLSAEDLFGKLKKAKNGR